MPRVTVTGSLGDAGFLSLAAFSPRIILTLSEPTVSGSALMATRPIVVIPDPTGVFAFNTGATDTMAGDPYYKVRFEWLDIGGAYIGADFPDWQLRIPSTGGSFGYLLELPANPAQTWVGPDAPPNPTPGRWWLKTTTGDLYEWSN